MIWLTKIIVYNVCFVKTFCAGKPTQKGLSQVGLSPTCDSPAIPIIILLMKSDLSSVTTALFRLVVVFTVRNVRWRTEFTDRE